MVNDEASIIRSIEDCSRELKVDLEVSTQKEISILTSNQTVLVETMSRLSNEVYYLKGKQQEQFLTLENYLKEILSLLKKG